MYKPIKFIGKNVPSKKNSKQITKNKCLINSKSVRNADKVFDVLFIQNKQEWLKQAENASYPMVLGFYYYRDSKRKWDIPNILQYPLDKMQEHNYIENDDSKSIIPIYLGEEVTKKENSGFYMQIIPTQEYNKLIKKYVNL